jgi:hypothetical protein
VLHVPDIAVSNDSTTKTLFQEDWWLTAAGNVDWIKVNWEGMQVAALPFVRRRLFGLRVLGMPFYTRTLGPILSLPPSKYPQERKNLQRVIRQIVDRLPPHDRFFHLLSPFDRSAFAFSLAGCTVGEHYTFRIDATAEIEAVWNNIHPAKRRLIRSAEGQLTVSDDLVIEQLISMLYEDRPHMDVHEVAALRRIYAACHERGQAKILAVRNIEGAAVAAVALIWDHRTTHFWVPVRRRALTGGKENCLLLWQSIKFALSRDLDFDFDGYLSRASAEFLSSFGAQLFVRPAITSSSLLGKLAYLAKDVMPRMAGRLTASFDHN